jgi:ATP-dependent Clp protease adaptor protein ClpS
VSSSSVSEPGGPPLSETVVVRPAPKTRIRPTRPPLYRVILLNDDFTPRAFVVKVLRRVFRMGTESAERVMLIAHSRGACVVAVYTREVAETKAQQATDLGRRHGYPLTFTIEPETDDGDGR